jgi:hypothetical protein
MSGQPSRNAKERLRLFLSECGRRAQVLRDSLRRQPNRIDPSSRFVPGFRYGYWEREARGLDLLKEWLSPEQFAQYNANSYFEVTGCHSGKRYRINHGTSMNIHELDGTGRPRVGWCFAPKGYLVAGDVMLAQKIALETDERGALAVANRFFVPTGPRNTLLQYWSSCWFYRAGWPSRKNLRDHDGNFYGYRTQGIGISIQTAGAQTTVDD